MIFGGDIGFVEMGIIEKFFFYLVIIEFLKIVRFVMRIFLFELKLFLFNFLFFELII